MASQNKNLWIVIVLIVAGAVILFLSFKQKDSSNKAVSMGEIFDQKPFGASPGTNLQFDKDPVPSPAIVTSPEHGQEAGFAVQVYSFKDQKRADAALLNLKEAGYSAYIEISDLGEKGTWYRVRIGGLQNETEARSMLENIRKNFNSGFIVKAKK